LGDGGGGVLPLLPLVALLPPPHAASVMVNSTVSVALRCEAAVMVDSPGVVEWGYFRWRRRADWPAVAMTDPSCTP
jgi:hypothetical protein